MKTINKQWLLRRRPEGELKIDDFEWVENELSPLKDGEVLVRNIYLSLDPTNRLWVNEKDSYLPAVKIGEVMRGLGLGIVEESNSNQFKSGDYVQGALGWQSHVAAKATELSKLDVPDGVPLTAFLGLFGPIGLTAYFGLMDIGRPVAGETLVVSAAAGAVGSIVGQIGKKEGCRVVGIAGTEEKCQWLVDELGFDAAVNYKTEDLASSLAKHCPRGIDVYFDNVGGETTEVAIRLANDFARIPLCGLISTYNDVDGDAYFREMSQILVKRIKLQGFIVIDYFSRAEEAMAYLIDAYQANQIRYRIDVVEGLEKAPAALNLLFTGSNRGKLIVKVDKGFKEFT